MANPGFCRSPDPGSMSHLTSPTVFGQTEGVETAPKQLENTTVVMDKQGGGRKVDKRGPVRIGDQLRGSELHSVGGQTLSHGQTGTFDDGHSLPYGRTMQDNGRSSSQGQFVSVGSQIANDVDRSEHRTVISDSRTSHGLAGQSLLLHRDQTGPVEHHVESGIEEGARLLLDLIDAGEIRLVNKVLLKCIMRWQLNGISYVVQSTSFFHKVYIVSCYPYVTRPG